MKTLALTLILVSSMLIAGCSDTGVTVSDDTRPEGVAPIATNPSPNPEISQAPKPMGKPHQWQDETNDWKYGPHINHEPKVEVAPVIAPRGTLQEAKNHNLQVVQTGPDDYEIR